MSLNSILITIPLNLLISGIYNPSFGFYLARDLKELQGAEIQRKQELGIRRGEKTREQIIGNSEQRKKQRVNPVLLCYCQVLK
jgi:FlaA1/EpsC-like NDP-sugar epimerase